MPSVYFCHGAQLVESANAFAGRRAEAAASPAKAIVNIFMMQPNNSDDILLSSLCQDFDVKLYCICFSAHGLHCLSMDAF